MAGDNGTVKNKKQFKSWWKICQEAGKDWSWRNKANTYPATEDKKVTWTKKEAKEQYRLLKDLLDYIENMTYEQYLEVISEEPKDQLHADSIMLLKEMWNK